MKIRLVTLGVLLLGAVVLGLGQHTAMIHLRSIAAELELTPTQVQNLTKQQAAQYILDNYPSITPSKLKAVSIFWVGMKEILLRDAVDRQTQARLILFKTRIESVYPEAVGLQTEHAKELALQLLPLLYGEVDPNDL